MENTKEWEGRIIEALKMQYKKYLRAVDDVDGMNASMARGAVNLHAARLNTVYDISMPQIHEIMLDAAEEYRKEKAGRIGWR